jgi:RNA polymerase sigma factor (sigma-70 family)
VVSTGITVRQELIMNPETVPVVGNEKLEKDFEKIYHQYRNKIYRFTTAYTQNHDEQDELVQDIFYNVYTALPRFKGKSALSTYIYAIARNTCRNFVKKAVRHRQKMDRMIKLYQPEMESSPCEAVIHSEETRFFLNAVSSLPEEYREVFFLFELEGLKYREISKVLDVPVGTVKSRLNRAKERIVSIIEEGNREKEGTS